MVFNPQTFLTSTVTAVVGEVKQKAFNMVVLPIGVLCDAFHGGSWTLECDKGKS